MRKIIIINVKSGSRNPYKVKNFQFSTLFFSFAPEKSGENGWSSGEMLKHIF